MRCPEVMQELSAPGAPLDAAALAGHLAGCPTCARWAAEVAQFDRVWSETRPLEPDVASFDRLWSRVSRAADEARRPTARPATLPMPMRVNGTPAPAHSRRHWAEFGMMASGFAAAAVLLIVLVRPMFIGQPTRPEIISGPSRTSPLVVKNFDSEPGQTLFIEISGSNSTAESRPSADVSETITVAAELDILNFMESQSPEAL